MTKTFKDYLKEAENQGIEAMADMQPGMGSLDKFRELYRKGIGTDDDAVVLRELIETLNSDALWSDDFPQLKPFVDETSDTITKELVPGNSADEKIMSLVKAINDDKWIGGFAQNLMQDFSMDEGSKGELDLRGDLEDELEDDPDYRANLEKEFLASLSPGERKKMGSKTKPIPQASKEEISRVKELAGIQTDEETYDGDDFYNNYGDMWYNEDDIMDEAEYQGHKVKLGKPMRGDVKKFKVYVRDPKTKNIKKVNFGDPNMKIKKSNPARRRSFRARHNCDNPGPRTKARYWSCRKW